MRKFCSDFRILSYVKMVLGPHIISNPSLSQVLSSMIGPNVTPLFSPPWSLYKIFVGITWLLALSALVKGGVPVSVALQSLKRDASKYLIERTDAALAYIKNGDNLGQSLSKTGFQFPDKEIIADLKIYAELDNFEEALESLANNWLEESVYLIEQKAAILNMVAILTVAAIIAWAVFGVFDMQDQITSAMGG